ncbi:MAG: hypothetical protein P1V97_25940, partial [Planctomycetota bacterium]|nr:hypothetical protein [Planctomycetota bacterium]
PPIQRGKTMDWYWKDIKTPGVWAAKDPSQNSVFENDHLSYTYRRKFLNASARSDRFLAADKGMKDNEDSDEGNHVNGYNVVYVDGHAEFISTTQRELLDKMYKELRMKTDKHSH